jgi:acyl-coenzyme A synthetase/AMP-(fatty) acid ligase
VAEGAVIGVPDESFGQRLLGYVVLRAGAKADPQLLRMHAAAAVMTPVMTRA